jgi:tetratricopeptide (TPR) repeat protein
MAGAGLSIKLRCASWQQLATIYRRDLSRGSMFLKASSQPPIGTLVRIDLELPSSTVIELSGVIVKHVTDPQRGTGVDLALEPLPTKSVWMIESALAADTKVRTEKSGGAAPAELSGASSGPIRHIDEGGDVAAAEEELLGALEAEAESLRKLNPFLVLGVGYETTDADVRAAFGELTKRYHPDRFARYQSAKLRQIAAEIFILIRDAYRRLSDASGRQQVLATIPKVPTRAQTQPRGSGPAPQRPPPPPTPPRVVGVPPKRLSTEPPVSRAHDAPTNPSSKTAELANTELAKPEDLAVPIAARDRKSGPVIRPQTPARGTGVAAPPAHIPPLGGAPTTQSPPLPASQATTIPISQGSSAESGDAVAVENLMDDGKFDEALAGFRVLVKRYPQERMYRAGIELCEGLRALAERDRLEAAQRFEAALELDPSNERAARELADMRRQATNERKGLLSRLMGKKEPPP